MRLLLPLLAFAATVAAEPKIPVSSGSYNDGKRPGQNAAFDSNTGLGAKKNGAGNAEGEVHGDNAVVAKSGNRRGSNTMVVGGEDRNAAAHFLGRKRGSVNGRIIVDDDRKYDSDAKRLKEQENVDPNDRKQALNNIKGLNVNGEGISSALTNTQQGDDNVFNLAAKPKNGNIRRGVAATEGCTDAYAKNCNKGTFRSRKVDTVITPDKGATTEEKQEGELVFDQKNGKGNQYYRYKVVCKPDRRDSSKCGETPVELESQSGDKYTCETAESKGNFAKTTCCNRKRCVASKTNADGDVTIEKEGTQVGDSKCKDSGVVKDAGNGLIMKEVSCKANIVVSRNNNDKGTSASDLKAVSSPTCHQKKVDGKEIKIDNVKYDADPNTDRDGNVKFDFPHCGTMSADVTFVGFSASELRDMGPRMAYQTIVNVSPAGQLKCIDDAVCIAKDDGNADANCYYCDMCNQKAQKGGIMGKFESKSACEEDMTSRKRRISARICPLDKEDGQKMCEVFSKKYDTKNSFWQKKGDVDVRFLIYLRQAARPAGMSEDEFHAREYRKLKARPFQYLRWKATNLIKGLASVDTFSQFLGGGRSANTAEQQAYKEFEAYMKDKSSKGILLTCQTFESDYNLFGKDLTKFTELFAAAANSRDLIVGTVPPQCKQFLNENRRHRYSSLGIANGR